MHTWWKFRASLYLVETFFFDYLQRSKVQIYKFFSAYLEQANFIYLFFFYLQHSKVQKNFFCVFRASQFYFYLQQSKENESVIHCCIIRAATIIEVPLLHGQRVKELEGAPHPQQHKEDGDGDQFLVRFAEDGHEASVEGAT